MNPVRGPALPAGRREGSELSLQELYTLHISRTKCEESCDAVPTGMGSRLPHLTSASNGIKHGEPEKVFVCPECALSYKDSEWAKKCALWCKEHKSCNLDIINTQSSKFSL